MLAKLACCVILHICFTRCSQPRSQIYPNISSAYPLWSGRARVLAGAL
jgi:hypothetical protein